MFYCFYFASAYRYNNTLFDQSKYNSISLYNCANALEALKTLLIPLGLRATIKYDSSNIPYLYIAEFLIANNVTLPTLKSGAKLKPADRVLKGFVVNTDNIGKFVTLGDGDSTMAIRSVYQCAQGLIADDYWAHYPGDSGLPVTVASALYVRPTGTNDIYSVYKITVRNYGQGGVTVSETGYYRIQPNWHLSYHIIAYATAAYYFSVLPRSSNIVGIYRRQTMRLEVACNTIDATIQDGNLFSFTIGTGAPEIFYIQSVEYDLDKQETKLISEGG